ncbi:MAG: FimB/Mfa2 family fimbrial subunit [Marinifilaceae bacterium]|nr:FimB/Mfa2 family fimbrial subunit [Marinifilaceae bacterium]
MKRFLLTIMAIGLIAVSCNWNDEGANKQVTLAVDSRGVANGEMSSLKLLIFDSGKLGQIIDVGTAERELGSITFSLMPGEYQLWAVANAAEANLDASLGSSLSEVKLKFIKNGDYYSGDCDFWSGSTKLTVTTDGVNSSVVSLERRVAKLKTTVTNIPEEIDDIYIRVSGTPTNVTLDGSKQGTKSEVGCELDYDIDKGVATAEVLLFPVESATLNIYYEIEGVVRMGTMSIDTMLSANSIVSVGATFGLTEEFKLSFTTPVWGETTQLPDDFTLIGSEVIVQDNRPVVGTPSGVNLVSNGSFENWTDGMADNWKFQDCQDSTVVRVEQGVLSEYYALRVDGKTYLSQDIAVEERKGYMIQLNANCLNPDYKWKCTCAWYKTASTMLGASYNVGIQTENYQGATDGWVDIFDSQYFRAPVGAKYLRIEFRGYSELDSGEGVLLDDFKVYEIVEK